LRQLLKNPGQLRILGDGTQSKSYIHVSDVVNAVLLAADRSPNRFAAYNVATGDYITVTDIAHLALECLGLDPKTVEITYTGGSRGWKGDVPIVRLNTDRIRSLGWANQHNTREALRQSMLAMIPDVQAGRL
jgi:UDP-glucose 4-epimerase